MISIPAQSYTAPGLEALVRTYGPLWMPLRDPLDVKWPHVMVITGVVGGTVYLNDPGPKDRQFFKERDIYWFNYYLDDKVGLMYMP